MMKDPDPILPFNHKKGGYGDYLAAVYAARTDDSAVAAKLYNNILLNDPQNTDWKGRAFYYSVIAGDPAANILAKEEMDDPISSLVLGNQAIMQNNWQEALKYFSNPPSDPVGRMTYVLLQAWCLYGAQKKDQAYALLEKNIKTPMGGIFLIHYGVMEYLAHNDQKAGIIFDKANESFSGANLLLTRAYGHWLFQHHRNGKAEAMVDNLVDVLPFLSVSKNDLRKNLSQFPVENARQGVAQAYLTIASLIQQDLAHQSDDDNDVNAQVAYKIGLHTEQIFLRFALQLNPDLSEAKIMLSGILAEQKNIELARNILLPIPLHDPLTTTMQLQSARFDGLLNHFPQAEGKIKALLVTYPKETHLWQALGDIYFAQKNYKGLIKAYSEVILLKKNRIKRDWQLFFVRGIAYEKEKQWSKAQVDLQKALSLAPNEPILLNYLGYSWALRHQNLKEAQKLLQKAVDIAPKEGAIRDSLGWAMVLNNQVPEAIKQLELAAETIPQDPELNYHLGVAYWKVGRYLEAVNQWNVALTCSPDVESRKLILRALQEAKKNKLLYPHYNEEHSKAR